PPEPVYLPAELEVLGVPEYYRLQRADGAVPANTSLHARTDTFLLLRHGSATQPLIQATYPPFSTRQEVPTPSPPGRDSSAAWAIRAVSLEGAVSPAEPFARVLFHLHGPDWLPGQRDHPGQRDLPCVTLHARHRGRVARGTCRLQVSATLPQGATSLGPLGLAAYRSVPPYPRGPPHSPPEPAELHYTVVAPEECGRAGGRERGPGGSALRYLGQLELRGAEPARRQEVRLDDKVLLRVPDTPLRPGQRFTAALALRHNFTADQLTLRIKAKKGLQVVAARPVVPGAWSAQLERTRGPKHWSVVVTCRRSGDSPVWPSWSRGTCASHHSQTSMAHRDLCVTQLSSQYGPVWPRGTCPLHHSHPSMAQLEQGDLCVAPLPSQYGPVGAEGPVFCTAPIPELEILNTAPLTGVPRAVPVKLVMVEAGGGVAEVTEPPGCESADKQVLQVSEACDAVFVGGKESRGARGARVDFWWRRLHASLRFTVWAPLLPLRVQLGDTALEQVRGWRLPGGPE
ncbi:T132A protein, partial [Nyctibius bracteatus]|nr:T132A protein [Nyctibius bracteatus]